jgi:hypothetical protein
MKYYEIDKSLENQAHLLQTDYLKGGDSTIFKNLFMLCYSIIKIKIMELIVDYHLPYQNDLEEKSSEGVLNVMERYKNEEKRIKRWGKTGDSTYFINDFFKILEFEAKKQLFYEGDKRYVRNRATYTTVSIEDLDEEIEKVEKTDKREIMEEFEKLAQEDKTIVFILGRYRAYKNAIKRIAEIKSKSWIFNRAVPLHKVFLLLHPEHIRRAK